jgi:hypothetical protein
MEPMTDDSKQSCAMSFVEAATNIVIGLGSRSWPLAMLRTPLGREHYLTLSHRRLAQGRLSAGHCLI